jgi:glycosyltransferase involved in cell wall biosynthesis
VLANATALGELSEQDLAAELAVRPIFASAALYEPFGLAALEAAQAGCALVLSDIPTFRELWDGVALFAGPNDSSGFEWAIGYLLDNPDERRRLGEAARERARRYTPSAMADAMLAHHAALCSVEMQAA